MYSTTVVFVVDAAIFFHRRRRRTSFFCCCCSLDDVWYGVYICLNDESYKGGGSMQPVGVSFFLYFVFVYAVLLLLLLLPMICPKITCFLSDVHLTNVRPASI